MILAKVQYLIVNQVLRGFPNRMEPFTDAYNRVIGPKFGIPFELVDLDALTEYYIKPILWDAQRMIRKKLSGKKLFASLR